MAKLTFVLGLSGSGKTHLSEQLEKQTGARLFTSLLADDSGLIVLLNCLKDGKDCIVDEVRFCLSAYRESIIQALAPIADLEIHWICFENDLETANWNVIHRTNKGDAEGHLNINLRLHPHYTYPANAEIIPLHRI
jgi:hypothetical protein